MKKYFLLYKGYTLGFIFIILFSCNNAFAVFLNLDDSQLQEAISYGKENAKKMDELTFIKEWFCQSQAYYKEYAVIATPFWIVAQEARTNTLQYKETKIEYYKQLALEAGKMLIFSVRMYGDKIDFAKNLHAVLKLKGNEEKIIQPIYIHNDLFAEMSENFLESPEYGFHTASSYGFPLDVRGNELVELVVVSPDGKEKIFKFDLSQIR